MFAYSKWVVAIMNLFGNLRSSYSQLVYYIHVQYTQLVHIYVCGEISNANTIKLLLYFSFKALRKQTPPYIFSPLSRGNSVFSVSGYLFFCYQTHYIGIYLHNIHICVFPLYTRRCVLEQRPCQPSFNLSCRAAVSQKFEIHCARKVF